MKNFSVEEKKTLIQEVKKRPLIWDLSERRSSNINAVDLAWDEVAGILNKSVMECKEVWAWLRKCHNYRLLNKRKSKDDDDSISSDMSNCSYQPNKKIKQELEVKLTENITALVDLQKSKFTDNSNQFLNLKFPIQMANFDRMMQKLPSDEVEDACFEITTLLYNRIKKNENNTTEQI